MKSLFDYEVYDRSGEKVGTVENVWEDDQGEAGFLGISTGWLGLGKTHLIPGRGITVDHQARTVRVPYDGEVIKSSSSFESSGDLEEDVETRLYSHYGIAGGVTSGSSVSSSTTAAATADYSAHVADTGTKAGPGGQAEGKQIEVPLAEERLHVSKRETSLGEVRLRKVVRTETVNQPVELRREEVVVERVTGGGSQPGAEAFTEKVISIPLTEEEAVVSKTVHSAGAVQATKVAESESETVSGTVRKEDVEVERDHKTERTGK